MRIQSQQQKYLHYSEDHYERECYGSSALGIDRYFLFLDYTYIKGWKLCRKRHLFRWLKPRRKRVGNFNTSGSRILKILFSSGQIKGNSIYLNALIVSEFLIIRSRWNHSSSEAEKKRLKILCSTAVTWCIDISWVKSFIFVFAFNAKSFAIAFKFFSFLFFLLVTFSRQAGKKCFAEKLLCCYPWHVW